MASPAANKAWAKAHPGWKAKTQARYAKNHPPPLFPSVAVTPKETSGLMSSARKQVRTTYDAAPLPALQGYLQPFADAHARAAAAGENYVNYLRSATNTAQGLSGAFNAALTGGMQTGQSSVAAQGGSVPASGAIPAPAASLIPATAIGSSFSGYLNALQPYVGAAVGETQRAIDQNQAQALGEYRAAETSRRAEILDAIQKLYGSNLDTLQSSKVAANKAAVTEYLALGKTAYQKQQLGQKASQFKTSTKLKQDKLALDRDRLGETTAYHQASLDVQRKKAKAKTGIDTTKYLKGLWEETSKPAGSVKTGPQGQIGGKYQIIETKVDEDGQAVGSPYKVTKTIPYGQKVPKARTWTNPDGSKVTRKVDLIEQVTPKKGATVKGRRMTAANWDAQVQAMRAAYGAKITPAWLKLYFPPRPKST